MILVVLPSARSRVGALLAMYDTAICQRERCQRVWSTTADGLGAQAHTTLCGGGTTPGLQVIVEAAGSRLPAANNPGASICT